MWFSSIFSSRRQSRVGNRRHSSATFKGVRRPAAGREAIRWACQEVLEARRLLSFAPAATYAANGPRGIDSGDFDGDGHADLVTANASAIGVRLNQGDGTFGGEVSYPIGDHIGLDVVVGDVNVDGRLDLVVSTQSSRISGYYTGYYGGQYPIFT